MTLRSLLIVMGLVAAPVLGDGANAQQMQVQRCEAKDGTVTYSNRECPAGTKPVRTVNTSPPISVPDQQAAKDRAKKDAAEVKKLEKDLKKVAEEEKRAAEKLLKSTTTETERIRAAYMNFYGRTPNEKELASSEKFLKQYKAQLAKERVAATRQERDTWAAFCQALFASAEFQYRK